jgi:hypothetical protein
LLCCRWTMGGMTQFVVATWLGGPWDGQAMRLEKGQGVVSALHPDELRDERNFDVDDLPRARQCPVSQRADGRLVIDWNAG